MEPSVVYTAGSRTGSSRQSVGRVKSAPAMRSSGGSRDGSMTARSTMTNASSRSNASAISNVSRITGWSSTTAMSNVAPNTARMSVRSSATSVGSVSTARLHSDRSWYNTLRNNFKTKHNVTIREAEPVKRVTASDEHARNTKYNPVLGRYRQKREDKTVKNKEAWSKKVKLERAIANDVRYGTNYDIVTFAPRRGKPSDEKAPKERPNLPNYTGAKYDIVTLIDQPSSAKLNPNANDESLDQIAARKLACRRNPKPKAVEKSEKRNPVSLEGEWSDDGKQNDVPAYSEQDIATIAEAAAAAVVNNGRSAKIGGTGAKVAYHRGRREYDPVNHRFLDEKVENAVHVAETNAAMEKAESRFKGLPTAEKDGAVVDIVTGFTVDPITGEKTTEYATLNMKPTRKPKAAMIDEGLKAKEAAEEAAMNSARRINRLSEERFYGAEVQRGYDVITLETWSQAPNKGPAICKDAKPKTSYEKLLEQQRRAAEEKAAEEKAAEERKARARSRARRSRPRSAPMVAPSTARSAASAGGFSNNSAIPSEARVQSRPNEVRRLSLGGGGGGERHEDPFAKVKVQAAPVSHQGGGKRRTVGGGKKAQRPPRHH